MGDKLLTTANPDRNDDFQLLEKLGLSSLDPDEARRFKPGRKGGMRCLPSVQ